jgi:hypothetical protein
MPHGHRHRVCPIDYHGRRRVPIGEPGSATKAARTRSASSTHWHDRARRRLFPRPLLKPASPLLWRAGSLTALAAVGLVPAAFPAHHFSDTAARAGAVAALLGPCALLLG